uniref:Src kinase associated phosphoprotein 1 n=1 Tax=Athene cunicularia TaxID=194338 RepID=A0A663MR20_ATHCN
SYTTAVREKLYAEGYLVDGLRNEHLSAKAREQRDVILFGFRQVKARFDQHDAGFGQDSSDENQSWSLAPSMTSDASLPSDFQDDGKSLMAEVSVFYSFAVLFFPEHSFFGSEWQKRWCVLNRRTFYYYANEKSKCFLKIYEFKKKKTNTKTVKSNHLNRAPTLPQEDS